MNKEQGSPHQNKKSIEGQTANIMTKAEKLTIGKYYELLHYVETKYPDESRHDTALRYIKERESRKSGAEKSGAGQE